MTIALQLQIDFRCSEVDTAVWRTWWRRTPRISFRALALPRVPTECQRTREQANYITLNSAVG